MTPDGIVVTLEPASSAYRAQACWAVSLGDADAGAGAKASPTYGSIVIVLPMAAAPLPAGADPYRPADRAVPQPTTATRATLMPKAPRQIRLTLFGRTATGTGCSQQSASRPAAAPDSPALRRIT